MVRGAVLLELVLQGLVGAAPTAAEGLSAEAQGLCLVHCAPGVYELRSTSLLSWHAKASEVPNAGLTGMGCSWVSHSAPMHASLYLLS